MTIDGQMNQTLGAFRSFRPWHDNQITFWESRTLMPSVHMSNSVSLLARKQWQSVISADEGRIAIINPTLKSNYLLRKENIDAVRPHVKLGFVIGEEAVTVSDLGRRGEDGKRKARVVVLQRENTLLEKMYWGTPNIPSGKEEYIHHSTSFPCSQT